MNQDAFVAKFPELPAADVHDLITFMGGAAGAIHDVSVGPDLTEVVTAIMLFGCHLRSLHPTRRPEYYRGLARLLDVRPRHFWIPVARRGRAYAINDFAERYRDFMFPVSVPPAKLIEARDDIETWRVLCGGRLDSLTPFQAKRSEFDCAASLNTFRVIDTALRHLPPPGGHIPYPRRLIYSKLRPTDTSPLPWERRNWWMHW